MENSSVFIGCGYCAFPKSGLSAKTTVVKKKTQFGQSTAFIVGTKLRLSHFSSRESNGTRPELGSSAVAI
ncbi:predicted protein [Brucella ceti M644/93/1]|uniref:Uncharacterized protein n=2 Tax=Brucella TaxID=234 RepID=A0ABM9Z8L0_9HYPH|nr:predicted protein [Brucella ceti M644/93/1]EEY01913.1 predicted protein [Brucella pinnipedialis B2/94]